MKIFEILSSNEFLDIVANHCFFDNSLSNRNTQEIISKLYYSQINNMVLIEDNNLIAHHCEDENELSALRNKMNEFAYVELSRDIENHYSDGEDSTITREEIDRKTREAAIILGYISA